MFFKYIFEELFGKFLTRLNWYVLDMLSTSFFSKILGRFFI